MITDYTYVLHVPPVPTVLTALLMLGVLLDGTLCSSDLRLCGSRNITCDVNATCVEDLGGTSSCVCDLDFSGNGTHCLATSSNGDSSDSDTIDLWIWITAGVGVVSLVTIPTITLLLCICINIRMKAKRRGFYDTYEGIVAKSSMLHYTASLRSISTQHVTAVDGQAVDREREFYV